jgi:hypothetical protein
MSKEILAREIKRKKEGWEEKEKEGEREA